MSNKPLYLCIESFQNEFVREIHNSHIFLSQALPILNEAKDGHGESLHKKNRKYYVPSRKKGKFAERTDHELKMIYDSFIDHTLYEVMLIRMVSSFETFLGAVLEKVFIEYPNKLTIKVKDVDPVKTVPLEYLFDSKSVSDILKKTIEQHLFGLFHAPAKAYLEYIEKVMKVDSSDPVFKEYFEVKATRDLLVHNSRTVNDAYLEKAGKLAREKKGKKILVDESYFNYCVVKFKRASFIIKRDCKKTFG